jgi:hypothetical protein
MSPRVKLAPSRPSARERSERCGVGDRGRFHHFGYADLVKRGEPDMDIFRLSDTSSTHHKLFRSVAASMS